MSVTIEESTYFGHMLEEMVTGYIAQHPDREHHYIGIKRDEHGDFIWHPDAPNIIGAPHCSICGRKMLEGTFAGSDALIGYPYWFCPTKSCVSGLAARMQRNISDYRIGAGMASAKTQAAEVMRIPVGCRNMTFNSYNGDVNDYVVDLYAGRSMLLVGKTGTGKTHLSIAMLLDACCENPQSGRYVNAPALFREIVSAVRSEGDYTKIIDGLISVKLLVLDDIGADKPTEHNRTTLYQIINERIMNGAQTIVTSNFTLDEISTAYDERLASRLGGFAVHVMSGKDYRVTRK